MKRQNDGKGEINALQNQFTAYLLVAVRHQKYAYFNRQSRLKSQEISVDYQSVQFTDGNTESSHWEDFPSMWQMEDTPMTRALEHLTERERYILLWRVLGSRSYKELSGSLGLRYNGTAAAYRRVIQKLRKELGGGKP